MSWIELVAQRRPPTVPPGMQLPENAKDWFRIENSAEDAESTDVYVYDSIGGWFGMFADEFIEAIGQIKTPKMNIRLNSPGGSVFEGIAIANAIRNHPANVTVYVDSLAASIASVIALAGDRVVMMPQSQFMVHNASGAAYGDATEMTKMADLLDKQSRNIAEAYAQHTGRPVAEWQQYMAAETWFTAEEAVAVGLADEVMPMRPKQDADDEQPATTNAQAQRSWDLSMYNYAGRAAAPTPVISNEAPAAAGTDVQPEASDGIVIPVEVADTVATLTRDDLVALVRDTVRAEIEAASKSATPSPQPDEDEDGDGDGDGDTDGDADDSASAKPEAAAEAAAEAPEQTLDTSPTGGAESTETYDENDVWLSLVDRLTDTTSPSADDVFMSLKEGW